MNNSWIFTVFLVCFILKLLFHPDVVSVYMFTSAEAACRVFVFNVIIFCCYLGPHEIKKTKTKTVNGV